MADAPTAFPWVTFITGLLSPILLGLMPRLWEGDIRRQQDEAEARRKRLEALEKAIAVVTTAKADLGIEVVTDNLKGELERILAEYADPLELSRDVLREWAKKPLLIRLFRTPRFAYPRDIAKTVRVLANSQRVMAVLSLGYIIAINILYLLSYKVMFLGQAFHLVSSILRADYSVVLLVLDFFVIYFYLIILSCGFRKFRLSNIALKIINNMLETTVSKSPTFPNEPQSTETTISLG